MKKHRFTKCMRRQLVTNESVHLIKYQRYEGIGLALQQCGNYSI